MLIRAAQLIHRWLRRHSSGMLMLVAIVSAAPYCHAQGSPTGSAPKNLSILSEEKPKARSEALPIPTGRKTHVIPFTKPEEAKDIFIEQNGGLISLMVREAPLRQVIALVAETQKLNLVFASPAESSVTATFDGIAWQRVIDALLSASGHTWTNTDGIILVTSIANADIAPPGAGGRRIEVFELDFASAVDVDQAVKGLLSPAGNSWVIEASSTDNRRTRDIVAVVDYPANLEQIADYVCQIDQPPRQVLIEANILQVDLSDECRNGVNFEQITSFRGNQVRFLSAGFADPLSPTASFLEVDGAGLDGLLEVLKTTTDAKTLASPRVLAVSGQQARIQIGDQLGYRITTTTQTSSLESVEFLDVGVVLTVTPRITRDGRILMRIKPEVSNGQIDPNTGLPAEETTEVETDILLNSGQGMVIGGLIQETDGIVQSKVPWLGDLPYLGLLFQKRNQIKERSEIIVTLLPHVQPYTPVVARRECNRFNRTQDRLMHGPLIANSRPYEAKLPDALTNPRRPMLSIRAKRQSPPIETISLETPADPDLIPLPPVIETMEVYLPQEPINSIPN